VDAFDVECLRCGERHRLGRGGLRQVQQGECPRCGYLGWAGTSELTERTRRDLRDRPVEARRLRLVG
jgi:transposase